MANPMLVHVTNISAYTPQETIELVSRSGARRANSRPDKVFLSAVSAGCLLGFGAAASLVVTTAPWLAENAPGVSRFLGATIFPVGVIMIALTGADLFTGGNMFTSAAFIQGRISIWKMLYHWSFCFFGNLAGALFVMAIIFGYGGVFDDDPYRANVIAFVTAIQIKPQWHQIFLRAIGCNWLVCLALYLGVQAKDLASKVIGMWFPIFCFVILGLDHVVANMFFIPLGIFLHTPGLDVGLYIWKGIIPVAIGNMLGGALFVGGYYWYMYLGFQEPVLVDGIGYEPLASRPGPVMTLKRWHGSSSASAGHDRDSPSTEV
ncbi:Formate/nitrite transporter-domain-containing protein [Schizothecium vesticola]|uniref:Formate/nitrite transporter-domain-containing protein n=1 Tax=Schizothecium vesticola TaxID=314040 RepID=A0AA40F155_9PEZI|nr:Formate/nitrite transporter-domain-containing protein [Schizothecium vesticola]